MKHIYFDETGTASREPIAIIAGVIIDPDLQLKALNRAIDKAVDELVPVWGRQDFYFHATDVFGKYKKTFGWDIDHCIRVVEQWLQIVHDFELHPLVTWVTKNRERYGKQNANRVAHGFAFSMAIRVIDDLMAHMAPNEMASVFAEDCPEVRSMLQELFKCLQNGERPPIEWWNSDLDHIAQGVSYLRKQDAPYLQLADAVAYAFNRYISGASGGDRYFHALMGKPEFEIRRDYRKSKSGYLIVLPKT